MSKNDSLKDITFNGYELHPGAPVTVCYVDGVRLDAGCQLAVEGSVVDRLEDEHGDLFGERFDVAKHANDTPLATALPRGAEDPRAVPAAPEAEAVGAGTGDDAGA